MTGRTIKGFTLIEIVIALAAIGVLAAIVFVAINPAEKIRLAHDSRRGSEASSVLEAVYKYSVDHGGQYPLHLSTTETPQVIGTRTSGCDTGCAAAGLTTPICADLGQDLVDNYIESMPIDPSGGDFDATFTGYYVEFSENNKIKIGACNPEETPVIKAKR